MVKRSGETFLGLIAATAFIALMMFFVVGVVFLATAVLALL